MVSGNRPVLFTSSTNETSFSALLMSPWFNRSDSGHGKCVKFRFMLVGYNDVALRFFQKTFENLTSTPIWEGRRSENGNILWQYGQVSITGTKEHQVWNTFCEAIFQILRSNVTVCIILITGSGAAFLSRYVVNFIANLCR